MERTFASTFCRIIKSLAAGEAVNLIVPNAKVLIFADRCIRKAGIPPKRVSFHGIPTDFCWCRDNGPIFITDSRGALLSDWRFTGWGRTKFHRHDNRIPRSIAGVLGLRYQSHRMVLEGGAIEFNGAGVAITSWPCLHQRNPGMPRESMERELKKAFGLKQVVWLQKAPPRNEDYTRGHVDGIARFIRRKKVIVGRITNPRDPVSRVFDSAAEIIEDAGFKVDRMDVPSRKQSSGRFFRYNYLNWYVANGIVLVGTFGRPSLDKPALSAVRRYWPRRRVIGINIRTLWEKGGGGIHCVTQQQPL